MKHTHTGTSVEVDASWLDMNQLDRFVTEVSESHHVTIYIAERDDNGGKLLVFGTTDAVSTMLQDEFGLDDEMLAWHLSTHRVIFAGLLTDDPAPAYDGKHRTAVA